MANLKEARDAFAAFKTELQRQAEPRTIKRTVYLGDGKGTGTSNMIVESNPAFVWARETLSTKQAFPVRLNRTVRPSFNLPVVIGKHPSDPYERILDVDETFVDYYPGASLISGVGAHHTQHEMGGGDEVFVDSRLFKPGLLRPTEPKSTSVTIMSFVHFYDEWSRFEQTDLDLSEYINDGQNRYVTIANDPTINELIVVVGDLIGSTFAAPFANVAFSNIPAPPKSSIPIGSVYLSAGIAKIDWPNIFDSRLHFSAPQAGYSDRINVLEKMLSYDPSFMMMGVQQEEYAPFIDVLDGGTF
jgi:hypothetical protein